MPSTMTDSGPCRKLLQITIPQETVQSAIERGFAEARNTFTLPGFRKGKAPRGLLEKKFGDGIRSDVMNDIIRDGIHDAIHENELSLVADPEVDPGGLSVDADADFSFEATVEVRPTFELPSMDDLKVNRLQQPITQTEIDNVLERLRGQMASMVPVEDRASIDSDLISGKMTLMESDAVVFEREGAGLVPKDVENIQGIPLGDAKDSFVGASCGDTISWSVELPDEFYIEDLKGHTVDASFDVEVVKAMDLPEIDDDFAVNFDKESLGELTNSIRDNLTNEQARIADHRAETAVLDEILSRCEFEIPESVVTRTLHSRISEAIREQAMPRIYAGEQIGEEEIKEMGDALKEELAPEVRRDVRRWYLIDAVATNEKVFATEDDVDLRIEQMAAQSGKKPSEMREEIIKENGFDEIRTNILESKVRKLLIERAEIVDEMGEADDSSASEEVTESNEQGEGND